MSTTHASSGQKVFGRDEVRALIARRLGEERVPQRFKIVTDTSDFFRVDYHDVVVLAGRPYLMGNYEREGRFGLDDEPKYWVRRATDLNDGATKILKLVFHEKMEAQVGDLVFQCVRSPRKEAAILDLVRGHRNFMQGFSVTDEAGNIIRVLEYILGKRLDNYIFEVCHDHEEYFHNHVPRLLDIFVELTRAIKFLHDHGHKHGDIRRDHILHDKKSGDYRWIDFDYDYWHDANMFGYDLFGLGNILIHLVGGGDITTQQLAQEDSPVLGRLTDDDLNIIFNNRVANLQKVYPYIPDALNFVLLHFSNGARLFYETTDQLLADLQEVTIG